MAVNMSDSGTAIDSLHVAVIEHVGDAMHGWDTDLRGGSWTPASRSTSPDLPPLRLGEAEPKHGE